MLVVEFEGNMNYFDKSTLLDDVLSKLARTGKEYGFWNKGFKQKNYK
jgi:hypothetical protein